MSEITAEQIYLMARKPAKARLHAPLRWVCMTAWYIGLHRILKMEECAFILSPLSFGFAGLSLASTLEAHMRDICGVVRAANRMPWVLGWNN